MPNVRLQTIDKLADLIIYELTATCAKCGYIVELRPAKLIQDHGGEMRLDDLRRRFKCRREGCGGRAKNVMVRVDTSSPGSSAFANSAIVKIVGDP